MGYDRDDDGYEDHIADFKAELDDLLEGFGLLWASIARLLQATGMLITVFLRIPDSRAPTFRNHFLEHLSLATAAPIVREIMDAQGLVGGRRLAKEMRRLNEYRNRLAHDALDFGLSPKEDGWPALRQRFAFKEGEIREVDAAELRAEIGRCQRLEDELLAVLARLSEPSD